MKHLIIIGLIGLSNLLLAQTTDYKPLSEADKAIAAIENAPIIYDSLRKVYKNRWSIGVVYGQRFISASNKTARLDTVTFNDFTSRRSFWGISGSRFISKNIQISLASNFTIYPRRQNINSISFGGANGLQVSGSGNGGALVNFSFGGKYIFMENKFTRPYLGLKLGLIRAIAKGGVGGFNAASGQFQEIVEQNTNFGYADLNIGFIHRMSPASMLDFNLGYQIASNSEEIGGITSPGGFNASISLHIIINAKKN